tara:strand:- start:588 stop:1187 length:600 start_codon:yes stop_codon:yes gene_type:complete
MSRPTALFSGDTLYWTIRVYDSSGVLIDADSTPTVAVRKNGATTADVVTVTKRAASTGIYDCSYDPALEVEGDQFTLEESVTISAQAYENSWELVTIDEMRGTDAASIPAAVWDALLASHTVSASFGERVLVSTNTNHEIAVTGSNHVAADVHDCQTDAIDAAALAASAVTEIQTGLITTGTAFTHTNQAGDTMTVTVT